MNTGDVLTRVTGSVKAQVEDLVRIHSRAGWDGIRIERSELFGALLMARSVFDINTRPYQLVDRWTNCFLRFCTFRAFDGCERQHQ